ncbi:MAG: hypothetical protein JWM02_2820 [Frankiales bacterium]|nr:hypothetical protein [Frankiales bacterium]
MTRRNLRLALTGVIAAGCLAAPMAPAQADNADAQSLVSIRNATADYRSFANSQADGFTTLVTNQQTQETCISNGSAGAMGQHYANAGRVGDGVIQRQRPEVLLYEPQANGTKVLTGVEYVVLAGDWLAHHDGPPVLFGKTFDLITSNPFGLPPFYALHAWAWQSNPSGDFSSWNPTVTCP